MPNAAFLYLLKISDVWYRKVTLDTNVLSKVQNFDSSKLGFSTLRSNLGVNRYIQSKQLK